MERQVYVKHIPTGRIFPWTEHLADRVKREPKEFIEIYGHVEKKKGLVEDGLRSQIDQNEAKAQKLSTGEGETEGEPEETPESK